MCGQRDTSSLIALVTVETELRYPFSAHTRTFLDTRNPSYSVSPVDVLRHRDAKSCAADKKLVRARLDRNHGTIVLQKVPCRPGSGQRCSEEIPSQRNSLCGARAAGVKHKAAGFTFALGSRQDVLQLLQDRVALG